MEHKKRGFTLIELLITISILGILSGIIISVINPGSLLSQARDAERLSDLDSVAKAISLAEADGELEFIDTQGSPGSSTQAGQAVDGSGWVVYTIPSGQTGLGRFLTALPLDPVNDTVDEVTYEYLYASDGTSFELNTILESSKNAAKMTTDGGDDPDVYEIGTASGLSLISPGGGPAPQ